MKMLIVMVPFMARIMMTGPMDINNKRKNILELRHFKMKVMEIKTTFTSIIHLLLELMDGMLGLLLWNITCQHLLKTRPKQS